MEKYDFQHAMTRFFGNRLDFLDCAKGLSERNSFHYCEPLRRLCIKGCSNITMEGLKNMITERSRLVDEDEDEEADEKGDDESDVESILECDAEDDEFMESGYLGPERPPRIHRAFRSCPN